jgi:hypothetical protein
MRGFLIVLFFTPIIWLQAENITSDSDANIFVVGLAAQRALEITGFKPWETIGDSSLTIQTDILNLNQEQMIKYTDEKPPATVRGRLTIIIRTQDSKHSSFTLEFVLEKQSDAEQWVKINSRGNFEKEMVAAIQNLIDRYRKSPSLN